MSPVKFKLKPTPVGESYSESELGERQFIYRAPNGREYSVDTKDCKNMEDVTAAIQAVKQQIDKFVQPVAEKEPSQDTKK